MDLLDSILKQFEREFLHPLPDNTNFPPEIEALLDPSTDEYMVDNLNQGREMDIVLDQRMYLVIVRYDSALDKWVIDEDSRHILEDDGGNYLVQELQVHTIRAVESRESG